MILQAFNELWEGKKYSLFGVFAMSNELMMKLLCVSSLNKPPAMTTLNTEGT